jgi:transcriptional regulator with XRE-family HTH domain
MGISQAELARRSGITRATINRIENAKVTSIDLGVLEKVAAALQVDPALLIDSGTRGRTRQTRRESAE